MEAGLQVLVAEGPDATVGSIAHRAGLSDASFFTYFASKDDLIAALVATRTDAWLGIAQRCARGEGPALERLETYFWEAARDVAPHRAYIGVAHAPAFEDAAELVATLGRLVARAERDGTLRPGLTAADVNALILIATYAAAHYLHARPTLWRRFVAVFVAGLRREPRAA